MPQKNKVPIHPTFGGKLHWWRRDRKKSLRGLALEAGCSWGLISHLEKQRTNPSYPTACKLAKALGVPVEYLWDHTPPPDSTPRG